MTPKVTLWSHLDAKQSFSGPCLHVLDASAMNGFGKGNGTTFISEVRCTGLEEKLIMCPHKEAEYHECGSAGVICRKSTCESVILTETLSLYIFLICQQMLVGVWMSQVLHSLHRSM